MSENLDKVIIALDVDSKEKALHFVDQLKSKVKIYKVGMQLFTRLGPSIIEEIKRRGCEVFLDLKYHDIPNTVKSAALEAANYGVFIFTVHTLGGREMLEQTNNHLEDYCQQKKIRKPIIAGVTILTSHDTSSLNEIGVTGDVQNAVKKLAYLASRSGIEAVVSSAHEISVIRNLIGKSMKIICPGVRIDTTNIHDQKRVMSVSEAFTCGADYVVLGREITQAKDLFEVLEKIK